MSSTPTRAQVNMVGPCVARARKVAYRVHEQPGLSCQTGKSGCCPGAIRAQRIVHDPRIFDRMSIWPYFNLH